MIENKFLKCTSLVDVVRLRALESPDKISCIFLNNDSEERMTYAELDQQARAIAATIQAKGIKPGERVLLLFAPGLPLIQAFLGCMYANCIAVPIYPPAQERLLEKAQRIIANSRPTYVFMTQQHLTLFADKEDALNPTFAKIPCHAVDTINLTAGDLWRPGIISGDDLAFLQYTSGSTMHPKGVMVGHLNLLDNAHKLYTAYQLNDDTVAFSWLPPHHDMGLIGSILTPIYGGFTAVLMSPFAFLQDPVLWLKFITKYKVTISPSPNFAYDYCVKRIKEEKKQGLDLSSWIIASNGAEPVRAETMEHFYQAFKQYGFKKEAFSPCYGLAEATLLVSGGMTGTVYRTLTLAKEEYQDHRVHFADENTPGSYTLVNSGKIIDTIKIVDPDTLIACDNDQIGEVWVRSNSVAQGYWDQEEETEHAFHSKIKGDESNIVYLRTGDLGFTHDDELYITGRIKDLIIIYGKNHYPQDIEYSLFHAPFHDQLGKCAAFVIQVNHEYKLTVMCEVHDEQMDKETQDELFNSIFKLIYRIHQLEIHNIVFISLKSMPYTTSGKVRRNFCRKHLLDGTLPVVASWKLKDKEHHAVPA